MELAVISTFHHTEGSNSGRLDPKLDALITRPRIHILTSFTGKPAILTELKPTTASS